MVNERPPLPRERGGERLTTLIDIMKHELSYWEDLAERYFQAETTDEEEALLRSFLCSKEAQDSRFDEVRATVSYLHVCRQSLSPDAAPARREKVGLLLAIAASLCIAAFLGWQEYREYNISSVRMAGEDIEADASQLMQQQMTEMFNPIYPSER